MEYRFWMYLVFQKGGGNMKKTEKKSPTKNAKFDKMVCQKD